MQSFMFTLISFLVALAVLITVHEFGHFWVARKLGVKVLRFAIGFGRPLWRRVSKVDGTEYVIAAIPLGGYVKMLDEREGTVPSDQLHRAFNRQKLWKRSAIVVAGPLFNFLFAIVAYWGLFVAGDVGLRPLIGEVEPGSMAERAGFQVGDELQKIGGRATPTWEAAVFTLMSKSLEGNDLEVVVRDREGYTEIRALEGETLATLPEDPAILETIGLSPAQPVVPPVIGEVLAGEPAAQVGLRPGDRIVAVDGQALENWRQWRDLVRGSPGRGLELRVERDGDLLEVRLVPRRLAKDGQVVGLIGASPRVPPDILEGFRTEVRLGPVDALLASARKTADLSVLMLRLLGRMVIGQASVENLSGPISIAESAGKSASYGLSYFVKFLAVVSISLGVLNLLPIPILDGGHLLFFLIEAVKGSPLSEQALIQGQRIGIVLLAALMTLAFYVDLSRLLG